MSTIKVDTINTRTGSGNITFSRPTVLTAGDIVAADIATDAVTTVKIAADAVDGTKIADNAINSEHYTDASIDEAHIAADAVNFVTHLKAGTDGELITWDASGNPAAVAVGTSGQVLTSGGTGVAPTFAAAAVGGNISDLSTWRLGADQAFSAAQNTVISGWTEMIEGSSYGYRRIGSAMTHSSGEFAFPSTGTWLVDCKMMLSWPNSTVPIYTQTKFEYTYNNSAWGTITNMFGVPGHNSGYGDRLEQGCSRMINVASITNDKVRLKHYNSHDGTFHGSNAIYSYMSFYKLSTELT